MSEDIEALKRRLEVLEDWWDTWVATLDPHCCQECRDELRALVVEQTQVIGAIEDKIAFYEANQTQAWHRVAAQDLRQAMRDAERAAVTNGRG